MPKVVARFCWVSAWVLTSVPAARAICVQEGNYESAPPASYQCAFGLENWSVSSWTFIGLGGSAIEVRASPGPLPAMSGTMDCATGGFSVSASVPGSCVTTYSLTGMIDAPGHWVGTFRALYSGSCSDCTSRSFAIEGTKGAVAVPPGPVSDGRLALAAVPNPTSGTVRFRFVTPGGLPVTLAVFDLLGRRLATVVGGERLPAGPHERAWRPHVEVSGFSAVRLARLTVGERSVVRRVVVLR